MRQTIVFFIIVFALLAAACSQTSDFVIVNNSSEPVKIVYTLRGAPPSATEGYSPKIIDARALNGGDWQALAPREYLIDMRARTVTVVLPAQKALRVFGIGAAAGRGGDSADFPLREIAMTGASGEIVLSDEAVRSAFVKENNNYFLHYK